MEDASLSTSIVQPGQYDTDWYGQILRNAWTQSHNFSLSGGSERTTHFLAFGYLEDEGIVLNNKFKRFNIRANTDYKINSKLNLGIPHQTLKGNLQLDRIEN